MMDLAKGQTKGKKEADSTFVLSAISGPIPDSKVPWA
jgi:hypothetical protein